MRAHKWIPVVLVIPFIALLYPPFYSSIKPTLFGLPFFIWYQFAWSIITAILTIAVYFIQRRLEAGARRRAEDLVESGSVSDAR